MPESASIPTCRRCDVDERPRAGGNVLGMDAAEASGVHHRAGEPGVCDDDVRPATEDQQRLPRLVGCPHDLDQLGFGLGFDPRSGRSSDPEGRVRCQAFSQDPPRR